jgi:predicted glycoside hydrolase/deacetylase ChbG (UPF0249 family)
MPVRFHADDLGLHPADDRAVFRAFEAGAIAGASILVTGASFKEAARQARALGLPTSLHLAIVDTAPLSPPSEIPSLVNPDGRFPPFFGAVVRRVLLGERPGGLGLGGLGLAGLRRADLRLEIGRQLQAFAEAGLIGAHGLQVDGHQHLHLLPAVFDALLAEGAHFPLMAIRVPRRSPHERRQLGPRALGFAAAEWLGRRAGRAAAGHGVRAISCWGVLYAGHLTQARAHDVLRSLPPGADGQVICHPGDDDHALGARYPWAYAWETELATVLALRGTP